MKIATLLTAALILGAMAVLAGCGNAESDSGGASTAEEPQLSNRLEVSAEFKGKTNPFAGQDVMKMAKMLFNGKGGCATCHGRDAKEPTETGLALVPPATNFNDPEFQAMGDDYIFWRISKGPEGSRNKKTGMTAYEELLTEDERWKIVSFIRSLKK